MDITDNITIEEGFIVGTVSTNKVGSASTFYVCTVEEFEKLTDDQAYKMLEEAMWESGQIQTYF